MHVQNNLIFGGLSRLERSICILLEGFLVRLASSGTVRQGEHNNSSSEIYIMYGYRVDQNLKITTWYNSILP